MIMLCLKNQAVNFCFTNFQRWKFHFEGLYCISARERRKKSLGYTRNWMWCNVKYDNFIMTAYVALASKEKKVKVIREIECGVVKKCDNAKVLMRPAFLRHRKCTLPLFHVSTLQTLFQNILHFLFLWKNMQHYFL